MPYKVTKGLTRPKTEQKYAFDRCLHTSGFVRQCNWHPDRAESTSLEKRKHHAKGQAKLENVSTSHVGRSMIVSKERLCDAYPALSFTAVILVDLIERPYSSGSLKSLSVGSLRGDITGAASQNFRERYELETSRARLRVIAYRLG
jgi:hypothetical protein